MPEQPALAANKDLRRVLGRAGQCLYDLARDIISETDEGKWRHLSKKHNSGDISEAIATILQNWDMGFSKRYPLRAKDLLRDVRELRNKWAHPTPENEFDRDDSFRLLDSLSRVLRQLEIGDAGLFADLDELKAGLLTVVTVVEPPMPVTASVETVIPKRVVPKRRAFPKAAAVMGVSVALTFGAIAVVMLKNSGHGGPAPQRSMLPLTLPAGPERVQPKVGPKPTPNAPTKKPETSKEAREKGMKLYREGEAYFKKSGDLHARDVIFRKSIEHFERSARLAPTNPEPLFNHAVVLEAMNRRSEARDLFKKVVALSGRQASFIKSKSQSSIARIERQLGPSNSSSPSAKR